MPSSVNLLRFTPLPLSLAFPNTGHLPFATPAGVPAVIVVPSPLPGFFQNTIAPQPIVFADGVAFNLRAAGKYTLGGGVGFQVDVVLSPSNAILATTGVQKASLTAGSDNFSLTAKLLWDSTSTNLRGTYSGTVGAAVLATSQLATANQPASVSALQFGVNVTVLNPNAVNAFTLTELSCEFV